MTLLHAPSRLDISDKFDSDIQSVVYKVGVAKEPIKSNRILGVDICHETLISTITFEAEDEIGGGRSHSGDTRIMIVMLYPFINYSPFLCAVNFGYSLRSAPRSAYVVLS